MRFPLAKQEVSGYKFGVPTSYSSFHLGVDYRASTGTILYAPEDGEVIREYFGQGGNTLILKGKSGYTYRFMHLQEFTVSLGGVKEGTLIGKCDNTGLSDFAHLHLDITKPGLTVDSNKPSNFVDPEKYNWGVIIPPMTCEQQLEQEKKDHAESIKEKELNYEKWQSELTRANTLEEQLAIEKEGHEATLAQLKTSQEEVTRLEEKMKVNQTKIDQIKGIVL